MPGGQQLTYDLHLENVSGGAVTGVSVASALGDHVAFVPGSATCGGTYDSGADTVTFPVGAMAAGGTRDCRLRVLVDASPFSTTTFEDDFEPDLSGWVATHGAGAVDWSLSVADPHSPTHAAFSTDPPVVSDQYLAMAAPVRIAAGDTLSFWHKRGLEPGFDGGVVEVSTDGGTTWNDLGEAAFTQNPYNATISASFGNPLAGRRAFSGSAPYVRSVASLGAYVGQDVQVRFRTGTDESVAGTGWTVDDVHIGNEVSTTNVLTTRADGFPDYVQEVTTAIVEPAQVPEAPTVTGSTPSAGAVSVAFTANGDGGSPITGFTAECVSTDGGVTGSTSGAASPLGVSGLSAGRSYHCRVLATNAQGDGPFSAFGPTVTVPAQVPEAPTVTGSTPSAGAVSVAFTANGDGGSPITGFTAECVSTDGGVTGSTSGAASPLGVSGLSAGRSYHCRVLATNAQGDGPFSAFGPTVTVPAPPPPPTTRPGRPVVDRSVPLRRKKARISFSLASDGGSRVTRFQVSCKSPNRGKTRQAKRNRSPMTVKKLSAGKKYRCKVRATNAVGTGPWSKPGKKFRAKR